MQEHAFDMLDRLDAVQRDPPSTESGFNSDTELQIFPTTRAMELPNTGDPDSKMKEPQTHILESAWYSSFGWSINRGIIH